MIALGRYILSINLITFIIRGWDKYQAIKGGWRVSEKQLLKLCRAGGRAGGLLGMEIWRHKTIKGSFLQQYLTVVGVWILLLSALGYHTYLP